MWVSKGPLRGHKVGTKLVRNECNGNNGDCISKEAVSDSLEHIQVLKPLDNLENVEWN